MVETLNRRSHPWEAWNHFWIKKQASITTDRNTACSAISCIAFIFLGFMVVLNWSNALVVCALPHFLVLALCICPSFYRRLNMAMFLLQINLDRHECKKMLNELTCKASKPQPPSQAYETSFILLNNTTTKQLVHSSESRVSLDS